MLMYSIDILKETKMINLFCDVLGITEEMFGNELVQIYTIGMASVCLCAVIGMLLWFILSVFRR